MKAQPLIKYLIPPPGGPLQKPASGPKPQGKLQKNAAEKRVIIQPNDIISNLAKKARLNNDEEYNEAQESQTRVPAVMTQSRMRGESSYNPIQEPRSN